MAKNQALENMTKDMLLSIAKQKELNVSSKNTKSEIIDAINGASKNPKEGKSFNGES